MENRTTNADPFKGSAQPQTDPTQHMRYERVKAINDICYYFSRRTDDFDVDRAYEMIDGYRIKYQRWVYSDITNYIFTGCSDDDLEAFNNNLEKLQAYIYEREAGKSECLSGAKSPNLIMIDKFADHSNLAQRQRLLVINNDNDFKNKFEQHAGVYSANLEKELNKELISLVSLFTALSFIVFGGINSLDNIFSDVGSVPIIELVIVGCVWSLGILNLVFAFLYLISKLTKLSIRVVDTPNATLAQKYPFWVWSNFLLFFILSVFCWLYYVDYSNSGSWLLNLTREHSLTSLIVGGGTILLLFSLVFFFLHHSRKKRKGNTESE